MLLCSKCHRERHGWNNGFSYDEKKSKGRFKMPSKLFWDLRRLASDQRTDFSELLNEAVRDLLVKYKKRNDDDRKRNNATTITMMEDEKDIIKSTLMSGKTREQLSQSLQMCIKDIGKQNVLGVQFDKIGSDLPNEQGDKVIYHIARMQYLRPSSHDVI
jgi:hypothetical protein